ncbi:hypothetical protein HLB23_28505 [Nocardia uniformis]|uniref:Uncharacterized protein n=1 Tax=Nocardia uniformis TaxID=53432 RepID=A0A849CBM6_9NOCA|nr:hypothetical protein [Nocardia uniformis]NNH73750.1 hypothetical protein [Nocardia uniformis]
MPIVLHGRHDGALAERMIDQRCQIYRTRFALDAFRDPDYGDIRVTTGRATAAILVPRSLAANAASLLASESTPVFSVGRNVRVFLAQGLPDGQEAWRLSIALFRCAVVPILTPSPLVLPTPGDPRRCWLSVPHGPARPPIDVVASALLRAAQK